MRLVDVTLRDGGHQVNFDWPVHVAEQLLHAYSRVEAVDIVELGYWRQTGKFSGRFYNFDLALLGELISGLDERRPLLSMMADFHYCPKDLGTYPTLHDGIDLFRITARKEHINEAIVFCSDLKAHTGASVSLNLFNITNYKVNEILRALDGIGDKDLDMVYFADTHGALRIFEREDEFESYASRIKEMGMKAGFHLHNHSGFALDNYQRISALGYEYADASINGLGKGLGNLKMEEILPLESCLDLLQIWAENPELFSMPQNPFGIIGARCSVTDHYALEAMKQGLGVSQFFRIVRELEGDAKDNYAPGSFNMDES